MKNNTKKEIKSWILACVGSFFGLFIIFCVCFGGDFIFPFLKDVFSRDAGQNNVQDHKPSLKDNNINLRSKTLKIEKIVIITAEENPDNIWKLEWPDNYNCGSDTLRFADACEEISKEDRDFLLKYCNSHQNTSAGDFLCYISISTIDGKNHSGQSLSIYGEYPEDFDEFEEVINRICGSDKKYLSSNGNPQEITPEFFTAVTGITDDDIDNGTVPELIDHVGIDNVLTLNLYLINSYVYKIAHNYNLCRLLEYKIVSVPSTDEEWYDYAVKLADELGLDGEIIKGKAKYDELEWYEIKGLGDTEIRVFKTENIGEFIPRRAGEVDRQYQSYKIYEDTQGPTSEFFGFNSFDFTYSNDYKFAVGVEDDYSKEKEDFYKVAVAAKAISE